MGVTNLWQIISPVQKHCPLSSLQGQTLAVDLSIWVVEGQGVRQMQGIVSKPHLRNLFFRISHLLQMGVHLVFVIEGEAPELKHEVMVKRQQVRHQNQGGNQKYGPRGGKPHGRRNFNSCLRECCELLDLLGVPYVQSRGEAEAMCAALNAAKLVDACITNDGDAFLYGARTVYRNFTMNNKDPHVECYSMDDIEEELSFDREKLVGMALLLGCDYLPKGVPGVGMDKAVKLMKSYSGVNVLQRFTAWRTMDDSDCLNKVEAVVCRKARTVPDFPQTKVVSEFMDAKDKCPKQIAAWKRPKLVDLQDYALRKLDWAEEYTEEKTLPIITYWDMTHIKRGNTRVQHLIPLKIVKKRVRQGVQCFEVMWHKEWSGMKPEHRPDDGESKQYYTTIEEQSLFSSCFSEIVHAFEADQAERKKKPAGKRKKSKPTDEEHLNSADEVNSMTNKMSVLDIKVKSDSCHMKTTAPCTHLSGIERKISGNEKYDTVDLTVSNTDNASKTSGSNANMATGSVEYQCSGQNYYHDDIEDSDILLSVLGSCPTNSCVGLDSVEGMNSPETSIYKAGNLDFDTDVVEKSDSEEEYVPLSQRLQQKMRNKSADSVTYSAQECNKGSTDVMRDFVKKDSLSLSQNRKENTLSSLAGSSRKNSLLNTERSKGKNERNVEKFEKFASCLGSNKENIDVSLVCRSDLYLTERQVHQHGQRQCSKNAEASRYLHVPPFSTKQSLTEEITSYVRKPFQERAVTSLPNSVVHSPYLTTDDSKVADFTHMARMNFTSVSTPKLEEVCNSGQNIRGNFDKLHELDLTVYSPALSRKKLIDSSEVRTKSHCASERTTALKDSTYKDSSRRQNPMSAYTCTQYASPFTPASTNLLKTHLKKSSNQSMNSTCSVGASFALEYGNFNISSSLLQNFSQHSLLLSLMAEDNGVYGSPFVPSECSANMNLSTGASPCLSNIYYNGSFTASSTASDLTSPCQSNVSGIYASPKFDSSEVCKLSFCSNSVTHGSTQNIVTPSQINELSNLVQDLSFSETTVPKGTAISDTSILTKSECVKGSDLPSVNSMAGGSYDTNNESVSGLHASFEAYNCSNTRSIDDNVKRADNEESPVHLLGRLKSKLNKSSKSVLLADFVKQRKISVKPLPN